MDIISLPLSETFSRTFISAQNINIKSILIEHCDVTISFFCSCFRTKIINKTLWEKFMWAIKWWEVKVWGESVIKLCEGKNTTIYVQYFLALGCLPFLHVVFKDVLCVLLWVVLCVLLSSYVYLLYYVCIAVFTLDAGLLARSQYSEGLATGHLDKGFSWFSLCL